MQMEAAAITESLNGNVVSLQRTGEYLLSLTGQRVLFVLLFLTTTVEVTAQLENSHWFFGDSAGVRFTDTGLLTIDDAQLYSIEGCASISDSLGNLLFYTNGWRIRNRDGEVMPNGDSIDTWTTLDDLQDLTSITQATTILPRPDHLGQYYVFGNRKGSRTFYSLVDMSLDFGKGDVVPGQRRVIIHEGAGVNEKMAAVRHGNGRDWWLIRPEYAQWSPPFGIRDSNYYFLRVGPEGIEEIKEQSVGYSDAWLLRGEIDISQQGDKIAVVGSRSLEVRELDRCNGVLGARILVDTEIGSGGYGVAFSPDGSKVYLSYEGSNGILVQYDLELVGQPGFSRDTLMEIPGIYEFGQLQLGPDNLLYIPILKDAPEGSPDTLASYLHAINSPDEPYPLCDFQMWVQKLSPGINLGGLPNNPNYSLGALEGSPCDTLGGITSVTTNLSWNDLRVYPNPVDNWMHVQLPDDGGQMKIALYDATGRLLLNRDIESYGGVESIDVTNFSSGVYSVVVMSENVYSMRGRFVKN